MIDHRCYKISVRALQPNGYTVKVRDAINRPMGQTDMPELFEAGEPKVFPDYGLAVHTAKEAIDRLQSAPLKKADPVLVNEGLRQIVNEQSKTIAHLEAQNEAKDARIAELEAQIAATHEKIDNSVINLSGAPAGTVVQIKGHELLDWLVEVQAMLKGEVK
jgi:hypothetical protein